MGQLDVIVTVAGALIGAGLLVAGFMRDSRSAAEGERRIRLFVDTLLLGLHYASIGVAVAFFVLGLIHDDSHYWFAALAVLLVSFMIFRDLTLRNWSPLEWLGTTGMATRASAVRDERRSVLDELAGTKRASADEPSSGDASSDAAGGGTKYERTFRFEFHWPPKRGGS